MAQYTKTPPDNVEAWQVPAVIDVSTIPAWLKAIARHDVWNVEISAGTGELRVFLSNEGARKYPVAGDYMVQQPLLARPLLISQTAFEAQYTIVP